MDLRHLVTFLAVVETGSFTRAAEKLGYAQSSITAQIQSLEVELEAPLFDRLGKKILLTETGQQLFPYAQEITTLHNTAKEAILTGTSHSARLLSIGAPESLAAFRLPAIIREFKRKYPELKIILKPGLCWEMSQSIRSGDLDLAFVLQPENKEEDLHQEHLVEEEMALIAPPGHRLASYTSVLPLHLKDEVILSTEPGCTYRALFEQNLKNHGIYPNPELEFWSIEAIKQCVMSGLGISLIPLVTVKNEVREGKLVRLAWDDKDERLHTQIIYHKKKWLSPQVLDLLTIVRKHAEEWRNQQG
ncbi:MAG: LysR family transcriptional regulator [Gorillibacterium sp.]|nr:LysR family transcriptional regulator [Gorillibacterium sp.]